MINPNPDIITDKICNLTRLCRANIPTYIYSRTDRSTPGRSADWRKLPVHTLPRTNLSRTFRTPSRTRSPSVPVYFHYLCRTSRTRESEKKERSERERVLFLFVHSFWWKIQKIQKLGKPTDKPVRCSLIHFHSNEGSHRTIDRIPFDDLSPSVGITRERTQKKKKEEDFLRARRAREREREEFCAH